MPTKGLKAEESLELPASTPAPPPAAAGDKEMTSKGGNIMFTES
jgi:hypothetical protein